MSVTCKHKNRALSIDRSHIYCIDCCLVLKTHTLKERIEIGKKIEEEQQKKISLN